MRWKVALALLLPLAFLLFSCRGAQVQEVRIGTLFDYTGSLADFGPPIRNGADLAAKHVNDAGGVLGGKKIVLKHRDSQTSPTAGVDEARKLVTTDKVVAIVGSLASGVTIPVAQSVTIPNNVILISPSSTSPAITDLDDKDLVYRTTPSDALQGVVLGRLAAQLGFKTASTLYINNAYGQGLTQKFKESFEKAGGRVLAMVPHEEQQPSYTAELRRATEGKPDVLVAISYPGQAEVYLKEAIGAGFIKKFLFVDGTKSDDMIKKVGPEALEGTFGTAPGSPDTPERKAFADAYKAAYGELPPKPFIGEAYDAVVLLALAIEKAKSTKTEDIRKALREVANPPGEKVGPGPGGIKRALELVRKGTDIDYEGAAGSHNFDAKGDVITPIEVWKVQNGSIVSVRFESP